MVRKPMSVVVALGTAQTLAYGTTYYLPAVLANSMAAELGIATVWVFVGFSAGLLLAAALGPIAGRLIDVFGGRQMLAGSSLVFAAGLTILGSATGPVMLFVGWLVIGAGMSAGLYEAAFSTLARIYGVDARRSITGITLIAGFASTVCWPLSAYMDAEFGWRTACYVWAATHLVIGLPLYVYLPRAGLRHQPAAEAASSGSAEKRFAAMAALAFVFASGWFCSTAMAAHLPRVLQEAGASLPAAIAAAALVGPAQVAARILEFSLVRQVHPLISARVATLAHPAGVATLAAFGAPAAPVFTVLHGGGNGVMTIAIGTLPLVLFGAAGYGLRQGLLIVPARIAQAAAPFVFDVLLARYALGALWLTVGISFAAFLVLMLLPAARKLD